MLQFLAELFNVQIVDDVECHHIGAYPCFSDYVRVELLAALPFGNSLGAVKTHESQGRPPPQWLPQFHHRDEDCIDWKQARHQQVTNRDCRDTFNGFKRKILWTAKTLTRAQKLMTLAFPSPTSISAGE